VHLLVVSFIAGLVTVLAPCILPLLPIVVGGTAAGKSRTRPLVITSSLAASIVVFTLLLKASTALIQVPPLFWRGLSGGTIIVFGIISIFPSTWDWIAIRLGFGTGSQRLLARASGNGGVLGQVLIGAALGPVFSSCSPTYAIILATVLPAQFGLGLTYLISYALGIAVVMLALGYAGQKLVTRLGWLANPEGWFKKILGIIFLLVGIMILTGLDKQFETFLLDRGLVPAVNIEQLLLPTRDGAQSGSSAVASNSATGLGGGAKAQFALANPSVAPELVGIQGWINSQGETIAGLRGKVVLIDFWTYSCINCIHTLPHVQKLYDSYKNDGLVVLGIHAPEFSFEKVRSNVEQAVKDDHLTYPVALDNSLATWGAYNNQYWPAQYFIDRQGRIRHYHFGEGGEQNSELVIRQLLSEGGSVGGTGAATGSSHQPDPSQSKETYLGYQRAERFDGSGGLRHDQQYNYSLPTDLAANSWALGGNWSAGPQDTRSGDSATMRFRFTGSDVYLVMGSAQASTVRVLVDGKIVTGDLAGADVGQDGLAHVSTSRLYRLVHASSILRGATLELQFSPGITVNAFTFDS
jgi:cytochrome c biogenesis protein CcdA/thiol-disulfide isomerase/thioredoxin